MTYIIDPDNLIGIKASELPDALALDGSELIYVVQGGISKKSTTGGVAALITASVGAKTVSRSIGAPCPVVIGNFQVLYVGYNPNPEVRRVNGDGTYTYYNDAAVKVTEVAGLPDSVAIDVANDGAGALADNIQIIFRK